jgi:hypothetical protein
MEPLARLLHTKYCGERRCAIDPATGHGTRTASQRRSRRQQPVIPPVPPELKLFTTDGGIPPDEDCPMANYTLSLKNPPKRDYEELKRAAVMNKLKRDELANESMDPASRMYLAQEEKARAQQRRADYLYYRGRQPVGSSTHRAADVIRNFSIQNGLSVQAGALSLGKTNPEDLRGNLVELNGMTAAQTAAVLNHRNIPTPAGRTWDAAAVTRVRKSLDLRPPALPTPLDEAPRGRCLECTKAIPGSMRTDAKFCCEAHSKAYRRRAVTTHAANMKFKDYQQSAKAKADAEQVLKAYRVAVAELQASASRAGRPDVTFIATYGGVVGIHDAPLPPVRFTLWQNREAQGKWLPPAKKIVLDVTRVEGNLTSTHPDVLDLLSGVGATIAGPEKRATIFSFEMPQAEPDDVGMASMDVRFKGDPGETWGDGYDPPVEFDDDEPLIFPRPNLTEFHYRDYGSHTPMWNYSLIMREQHAEERMTNLLARPDHDAIVNDLWAVGRRDEAREFLLRRKAMLQSGGKGPVRDNSPTKQK